MNSTAILKRPIVMGLAASRLMYRAIGSIAGWVGISNSEQIITDKRSTKGQVLLLGAGPGDPELLTLKAYKALQLADVVLVDWLVNPEIMAMLPAHCEKVFVGKKCGMHSMSQSQIGELLVNYANQGRNVVRLKGGDPAIFARVAEECAVLSEHDIPFAILPGITSASGASAYAGIPLTHRDCAQSVRFITAHLQDPNRQPDWRKIVPSPNDKNGETLVFYMGLNRLEQIAQQLMNNGMPAHSAVAVIDQATTSEQRVCVAELEDIAHEVKQHSFSGPALIIVGEVVKKRVSVSQELLSSTPVSSC